MAACRKVTDKPLFVKMAPVNVAEIAKPSKPPRRRLSVINSIQGMAIDVHTRKSRVAKPQGRPFGPAVPPHRRAAWSGSRPGRRYPHQRCRRCHDRRGCGRVYPGRCHLRVGCMANFVDPCASLKIAHELEAWAESQGVKDINELVGAFEC